MFDVVENGRVGSTIALPTGQALLDHDYKGDSSLAWVKINTTKGELFIASIYGDQRRSKRIQLWNWMEVHLPTGNWLFCGDYNNIEFVEDSIGPSPFLHSSKRRAWNRLVDRFDLIDNCLTTILKFGPHFTR